MDTDLNISQVRNINIDFMKGFVMLLLPFFHSTTGRIHSIIGLYQMPLLMIISGFLTYRDNKVINSIWVVNRLKRLVIPFVFWSLFFWLPKYDEYALEDYVDVIFSTVYWFLIVLSIFSIIIWGCYNISEQWFSTKYGIILIMLVIDVLLKFMSIFIEFHLISLCAWHITFFFGGYILHEFYALDQIDNIKCCVGVVIGVMVFRSLYAGHGFFWGGRCGLMHML